MKVTIIGAGNIGGAVARGLMAANALPQENLTVVDLDESKLNELKAEYKSINTAKDGHDAASKSDVVILAVKPWLVEPVLSGIADTLTKDKIFACIAAGIDFAFLNKILKEPLAALSVLPWKTVA